MDPLQPPVRTSRQGITRRQVIKSIFATALGAMPGVIWFALAGSVQAVVIAGLGAFIGFAASLPGVSMKRVGKATVGTIAAYNVPPPLRERVYDHIAGETPPDRPAPQ
jgi:hypothetical protein